MKIEIKFQTNLVQSIFGWEKFQFCLYGKPSLFLVENSGDKVKMHWIPFPRADKR